MSKGPLSIWALVPFLPAWPILTDVFMLAVLGWGLGAVAMAWLWQSLFFAHRIGPRWRGRVLGVCGIAGVLSSCVPRCQAEPSWLTMVPVVSLAGGYLVGVLIQPVSDRAPKTLLWASSFAPLALYLYVGCLYLLGGATCPD